MIREEIIQHSGRAPDFIDEKKTRFLKKFCEENGVEILDVLGNVYDFTNYKVKYNQSQQYSLLHYHADNEESLFLNYIERYSG